MEKNVLPDVPHLIYVMDPMCSWCYGFAPVLKRVIAEQQTLKLNLVMGGLRPGATTPLESVTKDDIRQHWQEVAQTTGQPFNFSFFERKNFIYDTEPASRAVITMRYLNPAKELDLAEEIQNAFYANNQDVTKPDVLATIAEQLGVTAEAFMEKFSSELMAEKTQQDFLIARRLQAIAFPSLYLLNAKKISLICRGYKKHEAVKSRLDEALHGAIPH